MNPSPVVPPARLSVLALAVLLAGCAADAGRSNDTVDYSAGVIKSQPLDVPPDLTQLSRSTRYQPQGGVVSAAATPGEPSPAAGTPTVAPLARGAVNVARDGSQRWLVVPAPPESLWPMVKAFWLERGFTLASENPETGVMETNWAENRAKLPQDAIRRTLGRIIGGLYDSGERDRYRTRIERTAAGSEIFISHSGIQETYDGDNKDSTVWRVKPNDPQLEAEFLSLLMARLGTSETAARAAVAAAPEATPRARILAGASPAMEVDEPFDRAWRRVGLALDRSGFTVEDRDRAAGVYYVRYVDPDAEKNRPGFFARLLSGAPDTPTGPVRYRVVVKAAAEKSTVSVLTSDGSDAAGEAGKRIVGRLVNELR